MIPLKTITSKLGVIKVLKHCKTAFKHIIMFNHPISQCRILQTSDKSSKSSNDLFRNNVNQ